MIGLLIKSTILWDLFSLFPAYAGVILSLSEEPVFGVSFPRIRGGDPTDGGSDKYVKAFSPHTRG